MAEMDRAAVQALIGALPEQASDPRLYGGGAQRWQQDRNVRSLLEHLAMSGTETKSPGAFAEDPELMTRLAQRYMSPEREGAGEWDVAGVLSGLRGPTPTPTPTPTPAPPAGKKSPYETQLPQDVVMDLLRLVRGEEGAREPWLVSAN